LVKIGLEGLAKEIFRMLLYDMRTAMNPRRVRIFLAEKGIQIPIQAVDATQNENRTAAFLAINPLGKIPVLQLDDGTYLSESIAICRYLESLFPENPLFGQDPQTRAVIDMWIGRLESEIVLPLTSAFKHTGAYWQGKFPQEPAFGQWWRARAHEGYQWLDQVLADRAFVATERYSMADIVLQCALIMAKPTGTSIPPDCTHISRWYAEVSARPTARA
jgi:glutathione S-transferase